MKLLLNEVYKNRVINIENNLLMIYGENQTGKTKFLSDLMELIDKKNKLIFDQKEFDDYREVTLISEEWDLKKELSLAKTSPLRKMVVKNLLEKLESEDYDLFSEFKDNKILNFLLKEFAKIIDVEFKKYKITPKFDFKNEQDLIDKLFKLKITDQENDEIREELIPKSIKAQLFIKLLVEIEARNKIFLFDCPETFLDFNEQNELWEVIKKLREHNLVILTFRNPLFLQNAPHINKQFYLLNDGNIEILNFTKQILLNFYLLSSEKEYKQIATFADFEQSLQQIGFVLEDDDFKMLTERYFKPFLLNFLINYDSKSHKIRNLEFVFSEYEQFKYLLYGRQNNIALPDLKFSIPWLEDYFIQVG